MFISLSFTGWQFGPRSCRVALSAYLSFSLSEQENLGEESTALGRAGTGTETLITESPLIFHVLNCGAFMYRGFSVHL